jgi:hypothetical protein
MNGSFGSLAAILAQLPPTADFGRLAESEFVCQILLLRASIGQIQSLPCQFIPKGWDAI